MRHRHLPLLALLLAALAGCGGPSHGAASAAPALQRLDLSGDDSFAFAPPTLKAHPGHVVIAFHGKGSYPHNVVFPGLHRTSPSTTGGITGNDVELDLGVLMTGRYPFVCQYHAGVGMRGVLVVS